MQQNIAKFVTNFCTLTISGRSLQPRKTIYWLLIVCVLLSCNRKNEVAVKANTSLVNKYARGFTVTIAGNSKLVEVSYPYQNATEGYRYLLVPKGEVAPPHDPQTQMISVPINNIVCTSTTHIPLLDYLNVTDRLVGFPTTNYISSEKMRKRIDAGFVKDLGIDNSLNIELLATLQPSIVMGYTMTKDLGQLKKIQTLGIPVVVNAEYLEKNPLGRAEWIKFMALFFGREKTADSVFNRIESEYLSAKAIASSLKKKPTVLSGTLYGDEWFMPGGKNFGAQLLADSGCDYLWKSDSTEGFLQLSFESVYIKASEADLWIGVGSYESLAEIQTAEQRYSKFRPFKKGNLYSYNARKGAKGGSEFLELGYLRPDLILKDLVKIAHPELMTNHQLFFYKKLD
jgi:iron complex transport system substrate-binding protein